MNTCLRSYRMNMSRDKNKEMREKLTGHEITTTGKIERPCKSMQNG